MHLLRMLLLFILLPVFSFTGAQANDSLLMTYLLQRIDQLQCKENGVFMKGIFPCYRTYALNKVRDKADVNMFYTGLIGFTLRDIAPQLSAQQQKLASQIIKNTLTIYPKFQNVKGRPTYNFWPTNPRKILSNAGWINLFDKHLALPDDLDCTVITLLAMNAPDSTAKQVHSLMQSFTNTNGAKQMQSMLTDQRNIEAYSTWFGKKFPVEFDVSVLCNILYFVQRYNLPWTKADTSSLELIEKVLTQKQHITHPNDVSPYYSRTPKILYHLARLMSVKPIASLEKYREQLIEDAKNNLAVSNNFMDNVILQTALLKWGVASAEIKSFKANSLEELIENGPFSFFDGDMANQFSNPLKKWMRWIRLGKFSYECEGYNNLLLLEYLVWKNKKGKLVIPAKQIN